MSATTDDLPPGWARVPLREIGTWTGGGTPSKQNPTFWTDGTIPWVSPKDMKTDFLAQAEDMITEHAVEESSAKRIEAGSVLFVTRSGILRHTLPVAVNRVDVTVNQDLKTLTPADGIEPAYLLRFVQAANREMLHETVKDGTTVQSVRTKKLYDYPVPLAPTAEQRRIVDALEAAFADLDAGVAAIEAARRDLDRYRRSVLTAAVQGDLTADWRRQHPDAEPAPALLDRLAQERRERWEADQLAAYEAKGKTPPKTWRQRYKTPAEPEGEGLPDLPAGWAWASMDGLSWQSSYGTSTKCKYESGGPPVLRIPNIDDGGIDLADMKHAASREAVGTLNPLEPGDLLVVRTNGSENLIGRVGLVERPLDQPHFFASYLIRFRLNALVSHSWVRMNWQSDRLRRRIVGEAASSAGQYNISQSAIATFPIPVPPLAEQAAIVEAVEERLSVADSAAAELDRQRARADRLRLAILTRAFAGRLVPQDPTDEPATALLERVRQELAERKNATALRKRPMSTPEPKTSVSLVEIVQTQGPIEPRDLWKASEYESIDAFYAALKVEVEAKRLGEQKPSDTKRLIVLA